MWFIDYIIDVVKSWVTGFIKTWQWLWDRVTSIVNSAINGLKKWINTALNGIVQWFNSAINGVKDWVNSLINSLKGWVSNTVNGVKNAILSIVNPAVQFFSKLGSDVKNLLLGGIGALTDFVTDWFISILLSIVSAFIDGLTSGIENIEKKEREMRGR